MNLNLLKLRHSIFTLLIFLTINFPLFCHSEMLIEIDFNSGVDSLGKSEGILVFNGKNGFIATFTDDNSNGIKGGDANGVHISNKNAGNIKVGSSDDFVLGAFNSNYATDQN